MKMRILQYLFLMLAVSVSAVSVRSQVTTQNGIDLYRAAKYDEAITVLGSVVGSDKKDRFAWVYLGASLMKGGRAKDAVAAFRKGKAKAEDLVPGDDSPVTKLSKPRAHYTEMARQNVTTGVVRLAVELRSDGKIGSIFPVDTLPNGLTEQSIEVARSITFHPAVKNGNPVTTVAIVVYTFDIY